jgi:hypothetical protein
MAVTKPSIITTTPSFVSHDRRFPVIVLLRWFGNPEETSRNGNDKQWRYDPAWTSTEEAAPALSPLKTPLLTTKAVSTILPPLIVGIVGENSEQANLDECRVD